LHGITSEQTGSAEYMLDLAEPNAAVNVVPIHMAVNGRDDFTYQC
jgi:hypothetical protein